MSIERNQLVDIMTNSGKNEELEIDYLKDFKDDFLINTGDGLLLTGKFFEMGPMPCFKLLTEEFVLVASSGRLIELAVLSDDITWQAMDNLSVGTKIITKNGVQTVEAIKYMGIVDCVDIEILHTNNRYYTEGISSRR